MAAGDIVCLFFGTVSFIRAFFSFSFSLSLSFFSFFFLSTFKEERTAAHHDHASAHVTPAPSNQRLTKPFVFIPHKLRLLPGGRTHADLPHDNIYPSGPLRAPY